MWMYARQEQLHGILLIKMQIELWKKRDWMKLGRISNFVWQCGSV